MKTKLFTCLVLLVFIISCSDSQKRTSKIIGTWKLTSFQYGDRERQIMPDNLQRIKLITPEYFTWVQFDTMNKIVNNSAGGRFKFDGKNYLETIDFAGAGMKDYLDREQKFILDIKNDTMYLSGQLSDNLKIEEIWIKLTPLP